RGHLLEHALADLHAAVVERDRHPHRPSLATGGFAPAPRSDGALAYTSREQTTIGFRNGLIARMDSTVEHKHA
ncbi:MAG TPA: hypothetical protein VFU10_11860, partial [Gaiellaceae bacterium]|nr:hypothetical protein [Gaiellaceae bacterium]